MYYLGRMLIRSMFLVMFSISCFSQTITTFSESGDQSKNDNAYFIVTAYYSPLPDQEDYITGDYQGDIRLNGSGIRGASGKDVFPGMIAAPKKYAFGTKIYIEGLGVGSVEDRGGAIIEASDGGPSHDRLDVWMGFGDEGRKRAILWGARKVTGYTVESSAEVTIKFSDTLGLEIFGSSIGPDSSEADIKKLQEFLISLKMYSGLVDGDHDSIRDTIINYQLKHGIIRSKDDEEAGYFGAKTIAVIRKEFPTVSVIKSKKTTTKKTEPSSSSSQFTSTLSKTITSSSKQTEIEQLQLLLKHVGLYKGKIDGNYSSIKSTLINYQVKKKIISDKTQAGAGNFGPKTREMIKKDFQKILSQIDTKILESQTPVIKGPQKNIGPESSKDDIKQLQTFMNALNIYSGPINGNYASLKDSLINYQIKKGIVKSKNDEAAGYFGPKTREKMNKEVREIARK